MAIAPIEKRASEDALRLWPGVVVVVLQWLAWLVLPALVPEATIFGTLGGLVGGLAVVVWWAFLSRAPRAERWGAVALMVVALPATPLILHESLATAGMGVLFYLYAVPVLSLAFVGWAVVGRRLADGPRRVTMVATILVACGVWALVRTGGITADGTASFAWRWSATPEEQLLARAGDERPPPRPPAPVDAAAVTAADWPGFRGPGRDGVVRGVRIETDWSASPPVELWRRPIGPGWGSFAVGGDLLYTQEQRGDDEVVASYRVSTGEPVWMHRDPVRFWEANAGAGPRATPTLAAGRVYALGATGILNALDAGTGAALWSRDVASDTGKELPYWGFSSSPLVLDDTVVVAAAGRLAAYDIGSGEPRWLGPDGGDGYSSPHRAVLDGTAQVLLLSGVGATGVAPGDGTVLWEHAWKGAPIVQPALTADGDLLIGNVGAAGGIGTRRVAVDRAPDGWTTEERWTSIRLKPNFNDLVVHRGHAFGFDGRILACISVEDGSRRWKGGRYGNGQLVLLPDQDLLLVLSEQGELALVEATPEQFTELARFPAIEGKTWNHPALVGDVLLVRNGQEMAAFRLPPEP